MSWEYSTFTIDLTAAGEKALSGQPFGILQVLQITDTATGQLALDGEISLTLRISGETGDAIPLRNDGQVIGRAGEFDDALLEWSAQSGYEAKILIGFDPSTLRVSGAPVAQQLLGTATVSAELVDPDTSAGRTFIGHATGVAPAASNYTNIQIFNPAASGKLVYVQQARPYYGASGFVVLGLYNTALTTLSGNGYSKTDATASVAELRSQNDPSILGTRIGQVPMSSGNEPPPIEFNGPICLAAGKGLVLASDQVNTFFNAAMLQWVERNAS